MIDIDQALRSLGRILPPKETARLLNWWITAPKNRRGEPLWCSHRQISRCPVCESERK